MVRLFRHYVAFSELLLAAIEAIIFFAIMAALADNFAQDSMFPFVSGNPGILIVVMTVTTFVVLSSLGVYNRGALTQPRITGARAVLTFVMMFLTCAIIIHGDRFLNDQHRVSVLLPLLAVIVYAPATLLLRRIFAKILGWERLRRRILVIGPGAIADRIETVICRRAGRLSLVGCLECAPLCAPLPGDGQLAGYARARGVDEIVIAAEDHRDLPLGDLFDCRMCGLSVTDYASFHEREARSLDLDYSRLSWMIFSDGFRVDRGRMVMKRVFDIVVSAVLLLLTMPVSALTAALIRLESPGAILYRQERVGLNGRPFLITKFRSMRVDAEKEGPQWAQAKDSRVTRVGAFIRRTRIDEIPQVLNVLKGEMSFIGPRPERPVFVDGLRSAIAYYDERHRMKPGITGWAQVNYPYGASVEDARRKLGYDLYYIKNGSLFLDLIILCQTVRVILWGEGVR